MVVVFISSTILLRFMKEKIAVTAGSLLRGLFLKVDAFWLQFPMLNQEDGLACRSLKMLIFPEISSAYIWNVPAEGAEGLT